MGDDAQRDGYLLGSTEEEVARLAVQHQVWSEQSLAIWDRAGFGAGDVLLDVGCGPGLTTIDLARRVGPGGRVIAVDSSRRFLEHLERRAAEEGLDNIEIVERDALELDLDAASLDGAYARWLLCFVNDPATVVEHVARALKPGASFATTDYFNYRAFTFAPRSELMDRVVAAVQRAWRSRGGDLEIQGRTPTLMRNAGLEITDVRSIVRLARPGSALWEWPRAFFRNFLPVMVEMKWISEGDRYAFEREWEERSNNPAAFLSLPPMVDVIGRKTGTGY